MSRGRRPCNIRDAPGISGAGAAAHVILVGTRIVRVQRRREKCEIRMQTLSVLAVEDGAIIVASPAGERFRLPVDAALRARIASPTVAGDEKRLSPREIQAHVRAGLTAEQVAAMTGVPVASIERFVGPVLAERAYIVESALAVRLPPETEGARARTFGAVMGERLDALAAKEVRWTSAKEPSGWILAVGFVADDVQHSARWRFDAKHMRLDADNVEASTLSQQGVPAALTPRLRAIEPTAPVTIVPPAATEPATSPARPPQLHGTRVAPVPPTEPDRTRFDSAVFRFPPIEAGPKQDQDARRNPAAHAQPTTDQASQPRRGERERAQESGSDTGSLPVTRTIDVVETGDVFAPRPVADRRQPAKTAPQREPASIHRLPVRDPQPAPAQPTAALPPAVRQQPAAALPPVPVRPAPGQPPARPAPAPPRSATEPPARRRDRSARSAFGMLEPVAPEPVSERRLSNDRDRGAKAEDEQQTPAVRPRRGRTSMPSWDEIVFGRDEP
jgi:hypothetical protein